jgi:hypothetical protein
MPQLDIGIFFTEIIINFFFFWGIYMLALRYIFSFLTKIIRLRYFKIKTYNLNFWFFMLKLYKNFKINRIKYNSMYTILLDTIINYSYIVFLVKYSIIENFTKNLYKELYKELYNFNKYINNNIILIKVEFSI